MCLLCAVLTGAVHLHAAPRRIDPPWGVPALGQRLVWTETKRADRYLLLEAPLPEGVSTEKLQWAAYANKRTPLPSRLVMQTDDTAWFLVESASRFGVSRLYYGSPTGAVARTSQASRDSRPVKITTRTIKGRSFPRSWEELCYVMQFGAARGAAVASPDFRAVIPAEGGGRHTDHHKRANRGLFEMECYVMCETAGEYRWAVRSRGPVVLLVDGERGVEDFSPVEGEWTKGGPVSLSRGVHHLRLLTCGFRQVATGVGWIPPGAENITPLPASLLAGGQPPAHARFESLSRPIQPDFRFIVGAGYGFRGTPHEFFPVRLEDASRNWIGSEMVYQWSEGDSVLGREPVCRTRLREARAHQLQLTVADSLGFREQVERGVDLRDRAVTEYALAGRLTGLPATCYRDDVVRPVFEVRGEVPESVVLDFAWRTRSSSAEESWELTSLTGVVDYAQVPLGAQRAGGVQDLEWELRHGGAVIDRGAVLFDVYPFSSQPKAVRGEAWFAEDDTRLVLLPASRNRELHSSPAAGKRVLWLDDMMTVGGGVRGEQLQYRTMLRERVGSAASLTVLEPPAWERAPEAFGPLADLLWALQVAREHEDVAVLVLSLGGRDWLEFGDRVAWERRMAALTDLLSQQTAARIVWVTPPPYQYSGREWRTVAAAIQRLCSLRGASVADVFTAVSCHEDGLNRLLVGEHCQLSTRGHRVAADSVTRVVAELLEGADE